MDVFAKKKRIDIMSHMREKNIGIEKDIKKTHKVFLLKG
jgi:hypothetical protein